MTGSTYIPAFCIMPVFIRTSVLRVYGCVLSHTKTLVQKIRPEGLCVIHKTLVIGNPKTSIPGKCDPQIRNHQGYQGDQFQGVEAQEKKASKHKKRRRPSTRKEGAQAQERSTRKRRPRQEKKTAASKTLIDQSASKQDHHV